MFCFFGLCTLLRHEFNTFYLINVLQGGETAKKGCQSPDTLLLGLLSATRSAVGSTIWSAVGSTSWTSCRSQRLAIRNACGLTVEVVVTLVWAWLWRVVVVVVARLLVELSSVIVVVACALWRGRRTTARVEVLYGTTCGGHIHVNYNILWLAIEWSICVVCHC